MMQDTFIALLEKAGYRNTAARRAVLEAITESDEHFSADALWRKGKNAYARLGRATVYRTIDLLVGLGALRPIVVAGGGHVYACAREGHHHLVCSGCGAMTEFQTRQGCDEWEHIAQRNGFELSGHLVELYGTCRGCRSSTAPRNDHPEGLP